MSEYTFTYNDKGNNITFKIDLPESCKGYYWNMSNKLGSVGSLYKAEKVGDKITVTSASVGIASQVTLDDKNGGESVLWQGGKGETEKCHLYIFLRSFVDISSSAIGKMSTALKILASVANYTTKAGTKLFALPVIFEDGGQFTTTSLISYLEVFAEVYRLGVSFDLKNNRLHNGYIFTESPNDVKLPTATEEKPYTEEI